MPGKSERLKVEIKDSTAGDLRTFIITLTAPANDFQLTDLLKQRKVIEPLDAQLKQAVKDATESYLRAAESLVSALTTKATEAHKSRARESGNGRLPESLSGS